MKNLKQETVETSYISLEKLLDLADRRGWVQSAKNIRKAMAKGCKFHTVFASDGAFQLTATTPDEKETKTLLFFFMRDTKSLLVFYKVAAILIGDYDG